MYFHYEYIRHIMNTRQHHGKNSSQPVFFMKGSPKPLTPKKLQNSKDRL